MNYFEEELLNVIFQPVDRSDHLFPWTEGRTHLLCLGLELRVMQNLNKLIQIRELQNLNNLRGELSDTKEPSKTWSRSSDIFGPVISVKFTDRPIPDPNSVY